jgi:rhodanese-related sulfurtransferase
VEVSSRCHLVYALAPAGVSARAANELLNEYVADRSRGLAVWHDHFVGEHGGAVVLDVRDDDEEARLAEPGPLQGWQLSVHPLTFSLSAVGFSAQTSLTLEGYRDVTLEELAAAEPDDPRYWWRRPE